MSWKVWILALALVCIIEGIVPFVAPEKWIAAMKSIVEAGDVKTVRNAGLGLLLVGVGVIWLVTT